MRKTAYFLMLLLCMAGNSLFAQGPRPVEEGPVHEAFVTPVTGGIIMTAIPTPPPAPIEERIPRREDPETVWVRGYWHWDENWGDFLWVSGFWRKAPPDHFWVEGYWLETPQGWVRVSGLWSEIPEEEFAYIDGPIPDPVDESVSNPPGKDYFWISGVWEYSFDENEFYWYPGRWELMDPYWVFVPAHYEWRQEGYVYVPAYWDWPLENRGRLFSPVFFETRERVDVVYEPVVYVEDSFILRRLFIYYPDYSCFLYHHYHYHTPFWNDFCCTPPWWGWNTWWGFTWHDTWALWWWYGHPGYPNPAWLTLELSLEIPGPQGNLLQWMKKAEAPPIVLANGVVSPNRLRSAIEKATGKPSAILPSKPGLREQIDRIANPAPRDSRKILKPGGRRLPLDPKAVKPRMPKPDLGRGRPDRVRDSVQVPGKPKRPPRAERPKPHRAVPPSVREQERFAPPRRRSPSQWPSRPGYQDGQIDRRPRQPQGGRPQPQGQVPDSRPQRQPPRGKYPQGEVPQTQPPRGRYPQGETPQTQPPRGRYPQGETPQTQPPRGRYPQGETPQTQPPRGKYPQSEIPQTQPPRGRYPQGEVPQTQPPRGKYPQSEIPQTQPPRGRYPQGEVPQTQQPRGKYPQSEIPQTRSPRVSAPNQIAPRFQPQQQPQMQAQPQKRSQGGRPLPKRERQPKMVPQLEEIQQNVEQQEIQRGKRN